MISLEKKYNTYGLLITVASLLMVVTYATGKYDYWDLVISVLTTYFSYCYLKDKMQIDFFSTLVVCFIALKSSSMFIISFIQITPFYDVSKLIAKDSFDVTYGIAVSLISLLLAYFLQPKASINELKRIQSA